VDASRKSRESQPWGLEAVTFATKNAEHTLKWGGFCQEELEEVEGGGAEISESSAIEKKKTMPTPQTSTRDVP